MLNPKIRMKNKDPRVWMKKNPEIWKNKNAGDDKDD